LTLDFKKPVIDEFIDILETFVVILGPRGSGKSEFINKVIQDKK
jgi:hypothetical protein